MTSNWLKSLSQKAVQVKMLHPLYNASLGNDAEPLNFLHLPTDLFDADAGRGRWIANGYLDISGHRVALDHDQWLVNTNYENTPFFDKLHGFDFALELKSLGGNVGRKTLRDMSKKWLDHYERYDEKIWDANLTATRLVNWLIVYSFAFETASDDFIVRLHQSIKRQYTHLQYSLSQSQNLNLFDRFSCLWGLVVIGSYCPQLSDDIEFQSYIQLFKGAISDISLSDGGISDRNPQNMIEIIKMMMIARHALNVTSRAESEWLDNHIETYIRTMNIITHSDKDMPLFQGSVLPNKSDIETINKLSRIRVRRSDVCFEKYGYTSMRKGRTSIIIDHGKAEAHTSPLAFEMAYANNRLIVSCGAHVNGDEAWQDGLAGMNAHSTLCIEENEPKNAFINPKASLDLMDGACLFSGSHEGYSKDLSLTHTRRIYMDTNGEDVRGEDLCVRTIAIKPIPIVIRFHLHPSVKASLVESGQKALLRLPTGSGWLFECSNGQLSLEDSVYCADGFEIRKTQQICLRASMDDLNMQVKWGLKKQ